MAPTDPERVKEVFLVAADLPDVAGRTAYLDEACEGDADLRQRVEALLCSHEPDGSFLANPAVAPDPDDALTMAAAPQRAPDPAATSPARKRFLREAQSSAQVRHENVVQVCEIGEQPLPFLVMEFIPGETLQQRLDRTGPLDVPEVLRIGRQVAEGLAATHDHDLIHRDVKPANVLLESGPRGHAKLTDFGLARAADDASLSQSGVVAGTPMYMAPDTSKPGDPNPAVVAKMETPVPVVKPVQPCRPPSSSRKCGGN